jgi:rhodanese-related sulfurtransferase
VEEISSLELPYSPPFNTALDPIHVTSFIAENIIYERFNPIDWETVIKRLKEKDKNTLILDVRTPNELKDITERYSNWINIPYQSARTKIKDLPKDKDLIIVCSVGARAYEVARWLSAEGFERVYVPLGGIVLPKSWGERF